MQQVNLPKSNTNNAKTQNSSKSAPIKTAQKIQTNATKPAPPNSSKDPWSDPWGASEGGWSDPWGGDPASSATESKKLTPQERVEMIEMVYLEVLSRKPDTRDINYYKYSTLGEGEIRKQLLTGKEHKQLMVDGQAYKKVKGRADQSDVRVKMLESQIKDQVVEFRQMTELLKEKNRYIHELRVKLQNPYNLSDPKHTAVQQSRSHYSTPQAPVIEGSRPYQAPSQVQTPKSRINDTNFVPSQTNQSTLQKQQGTNFSTPAPQYTGAYKDMKKKNKTFFDRVRDVLSV